MRPVSQAGVGNTTGASLRDAIQNATIGRDRRIGVRKRECRRLLLRGVVWRREQRWHSGRRLRGGGGDFANDIVARVGNEYVARGIDGNTKRLVQLRQRGGATIPAVSLSAVASEN